MALSDFLSAFGQSFQDDYGMNPMQPEGGDLYSGGAGAMQQAQFGADRAAPAMQPQAPMRPAQPPKPSGLKNFLGVLGDALLVGNNAEPIYGPKMERQKLGNAMADYLGQSDAQLADLMRTDPDTAFQVLKLRQQMQPKAQEPFTLGAGQIRYGPNGEVIARGPERSAENDPMFVRELQALGIDPRSETARKIYAARNSPAGFMLNIDGAGGAPQQRAPQSGPAPGVVEDGYQFMGGDPASPSSWKKVSGGAGGNASGNFRP